MLIYTKIVDNIRKLFGNYSGNFPTNDDPELSYTDENGVAIELIPGDTYVDGGSSEGIQRVKRLSDNTEIVVSIDDEVIIGEMDLTPTWDQYVAFSSDKPFTLGVSNGLHNDGTLEYSFNTRAWITWDGSNINSSNKVIYLRGTGNSALYDAVGDAATIFVLSPADDNTITCSGNIETLLDYQTVMDGGHPQMGEGCFVELFSGCTSLATAPQLPATTLAARCYQYMFSGCTSLTTAPALPAMIMTQNCYNSMFYGCTSLATAPVLPATSLHYRCYYQMFQGCTSLTAAPALPVVYLAEECYGSMFANCTSLTSAPTLPASTLLQGCYQQMFSGCTSLINAPELPATTLDIRCYNYMFGRCTSLTEAPQLPATTLADWCYDSMFSGCTSIKLSATQTAEYTIPYVIPSSGTGVDATDALYYMFKDTGGTFTGTPVINTTYYMAVS